MERHEGRAKQTTRGGKCRVRARLVVRVALGLVSMPVVSLVATSARAGHAFSYTAPAECPEEPAFLSAVADRGTPIAPLASAADAVVVAVTKVESGYDGALRVRHGEGEWSERRVHGESCAEVVDALAVVTAMTLRDTTAPVAVAPAAVVRPPVVSGRLRLRATGDTQSLDVRSTRAQCASCRRIHSRLTEARSSGSCPAPSSRGTTSSCRARAS